jgi:hypothetical protein
MRSEVRIQMYRHQREIAYFYHFRTHTKASSTQQTTKIVINEICRLITMDVKIFVKTPINAMLHITELLLTINNTETSLQQITLLLHRVLKQYYLEFLKNFQTYEICLHGIHYFLYSRRDISPTAGIFNNETYYINLEHSNLK